jgi:hypothetical protein
VHKLKADGFVEILSGFEPKGYLEDHDVSYRYFIFRTDECNEASGERFIVYCRPIREDLKSLAMQAPLIEGSTLKAWIEKLKEIDRKLTEADEEFEKLLGLGGLEGPETPAKVGVEPPTEFLDRVNWLKDRIVDLLGPEFEEMDSKGKIMKVFSVITKYFEFVRVPSLDVSENPEVYALDGDVLTSVDNVLAPIVGALVKAGLVRKSIMGDLKLATHSTGRVTSWRELNPWDKIRLRDGVLDLESLELLDKTSYYFTYRLDVSLAREELKEIKDGGYKVEDNPVYRSWRTFFEDVDWEYLVDSLGAWLAPFRFKLVAFLIGPRNAGKSTLLMNLTKPIDPLVARASLRSIIGYQFGLQPLIGKHLLVHSERGDVVLKNLDIINNLVGESDYIPVERKHLPAVTIRSLKAAMFSMNDPPILWEHGGETLAAFLERLNIIFMRAPQGFKPVKDYRVDPKEAFKFLLRCRVQLESRGWEVRKRGFEEKLDYLAKMANTALRFLESEYIAQDPYGRVKGVELYETYVKWCKEQGLAPMGRNTFYVAVATKYTKYEAEGVVWFKGLRLRVREGLESYR